MKLTLHREGKEVIKGVLSNKLLPLVFGTLFCWGTMSLRNGIKHVPQK